MTFRRPARGPVLARWTGRRLTALVLCSLSLLVSACQKDETVAGYGAADRLWVLQELDGAAFPARATLTFPERGKIAGQAPCNSYRASMESPYPWFRAGPIAATRRACPELDAERRFLESLAAMTQSEVLGGTLILSDETGREMVFKAGG